MTDGTGNDTPAHEAPTHGADIYQFTPPPPTTAEIAGAAALRRARRRRRLRRTAAGLAVVIGGSTGTAVAALSTGASGQAPSLTAANVAATSGAPTTTTQPTTPLPVRGLPGMRGRERWGAGAMSGPFGPAAMGGDVVHGTYTVKTAGGNYQTVQVQTGTATDVGATAIEVTSADGYKQSYTVSDSTLVDADASGITSVKHGDDVVVQATVSGTTITAQRVVDLTQVGAARNRWPGGAGPNGSGPNGSGPAPAA